MRSPQKSNRSRGRGNRKSNGNSANRVFDSAGPDGKVRGTPQQIIEKYLMLARDAQTSGDRVGSENFLQHAEHYQRILSAATSAQAEQRREAADSEESDQPYENGAPPRAAPQNEGGAAPSGGGAQHRTEAPEQSQPAPRPAAAEVEPATNGATIAGMGVIDSNEAENSLLVVDEEPAPAQPRRRKPRPRRQDPEAPAAEAAPQSPASAPASGTDPVQE